MTPDYQTGDLVVVVLASIGVVVFVIHFNAVFRNTFLKKD